MVDPVTVLEAFKAWQDSHKAGSASGSSAAANAVKDLADFISNSDLIGKATRHLEPHVKRQMAEDLAKRALVDSQEYDDPEAKAFAQVARIQAEAAKMTYELATQARDDGDQYGYEALMKSADALSQEAKSAQKNADQFERTHDLVESAGEPKVSMSLPDDPKPVVKPVVRQDTITMSKKSEVELDDVKAATVRAEATAARVAAKTDYESAASQIGLARDESARDQWSAEQAAQKAGVQVTNEKNELSELRAHAQKLRNEADSVRTTDPDAARALLNSASQTDALVRVTETRLKAAQAEVDRQTKLSEEAKQEVKTHETELRDLQKQHANAEQAIDGLEERARLMEAAEQKFADANRTNDPKLRKEAEALVDRAEKVHVDQDALKIDAPKLPTEAASAAANASAGHPVDVGHPAAPTQPAASTGPTTAVLDATDASAVRAEATAARHAAEANFEGRLQDLTLQRDARVRDQVQAEQASKAAGMQVKREQGVVDKARAEVERLTKEADAAAAKSPRQAEHLREQAQKVEADQHVAEARLASAQREVDAQQTRSNTAKQDVEALEGQYTDLQHRYADISKGDLQRLEQRATLLEDAQRKLAEADRTGDPKLRAEAEVLVKKAEEVQVDRGKVREFATDLPAATPGTTELRPDGTPVPTPPVPPLSADPTAAELDALADKYAAAGKAVHQRRLDEERTVDADDKAFNEGVEKAHVMDDALTRLAKDRVEVEATRTEARATADRLQREASALDGKEAEEKREEADLAIARAERQTTKLKELDEREANLKTQLETLKKDLNADVEREAQTSEQLEKTGDQLDDAARAMAKAHESRVAADKAFAEAKVARDAGNQDLGNQLELKAQTAAAESRQLFEQAKQMAPKDDYARKALEDVGVPVEPAVAPPVTAPSVTAPPVTAPPVTGQPVSATTPSPPHPTIADPSVAMPMVAKTIDAFEPAKPGGDGSVTPPPAGSGGHEQAGVSAPTTEPRISAVEHAASAGDAALAGATLAATNPSVPQGAHDPVGDTLGTGHADASGSLPLTGLQSAGLPPTGTHTAGGASAGADHALAQAGSTEGGSDFLTRVMESSDHVDTTHDPVDLGQGFNPPDATHTHETGADYTGQSGAQSDGYTPAPDENQHLSNPDHGPDGLAPQ